MEASERGFHRVGSNVKVYKMAIILSPQNVTLGSDIIIDDFVFIGAHKRLVLGNRVHISSHSSITGGGRVLLSDFSGMGSGARLISGTDDFTEGRLNGSAIPQEFRETHRGTIILEPHAIMSAILPLSPRLLKLSILLAGSSLPDAQPAYCPWRCSGARVCF